MVFMGLKVTNIRVERSDKVTITAGGTTKFASDSSTYRCES